MFNYSEKLNSYLQSCKYLVSSIEFAISEKMYFAMDDEKGLIIYNTPDGRSKVAPMAWDGMVWLKQQSIAELFGTSIPNISIHLSNIFKERELYKDSVVKDYLTTAADGKPYHVMFYSLPIILSMRPKAFLPKAS